VAKERAKWERVKVKFMLGDYEKFSSHRKFEGALFYDCLHHTTNKLEAIKNAYRNLKSGGKIVIFEPNWIHKFMSKEAMEKYGTTEIGCSIFGWKKLFKKAGFRNIKTYYCFESLYCNNDIKEVLNFFARTCYKTLPFDIVSRVILRAEKY
jgi:SAM-dependent methyltransferase